MIDEEPLDAAEHVLGGPIRWQWMHALQIVEDIPRAAARIHHNRGLDRAGVRIDPDEIERDAGSFELPHRKAAQFVFSEASSEGRRHTLGGGGHERRRGQAAAPLLAAVDSLFLIRRRVTIDVQQLVDGNAADPQQGRRDSRCGWCLAVDGRILSQS